jgi:hypothetical protein
LNNLSMRAKNRLQAVAMTSEGLLIFMLLDPHVLLEFAVGAGTAPVNRRRPSDRRKDQLER